MRLNLSEGKPPIPGRFPPKKCENNRIDAYIYPEDKRLSLCTLANYYMDSIYVRCCSAIINPETLDVRLHSSCVR
jgi:hypothetical protein